LQRAQKQGTRTLPRLVYDVKVVKEYLKHPTWGTGLALGARHARRLHRPCVFRFRPSADACAALARYPPAPPAARPSCRTHTRAHTPPCLTPLRTHADIGGGLLSVVALSQAPVSVVQPIASGGLAILAVFSHFYLEERLTRSEWGAVALAAVGTMGVAACAPEPVADADAVLSPAGALALLALLAAGEGALRAARGEALLGAVAGRSRGGGGVAASPSSGASGASGGGGALHRMVGAARMDELTAGAQAGVCFSLSAASCRAGFVLSRVSRLAPPLGLAASAALTAAGVVCQTRGLKDGAAMVVCTAGAVTTMLTGAAAGVLVLGEGLPATRSGRLIWLLCWSAIAAGVAGISGAGGKQAAQVKGVTPMKTGGGGGGSGAGGGASGGRGLLPLFIRPPKEHESAL
jgi:hypothetical protein